MEPPTTVSDFGSTPNESNGSHGGSAHQRAAEIFERDRIYRDLVTYPFFQNTEFVSGLAAIFGHPEAPCSPEEIQQNGDTVQEAKLFYYAQRYKVNIPLTLDTFKSWLEVEEIKKKADEEFEAYLAQGEYPEIVQNPQLSALLPPEQGSHPELPPAHVPSRPWRSVTDSIPPTPYRPRPQIPYQPSTSLPAPTHDMAPQEPAPSTPSQLNPNAATFTPTPVTSDASNPAEANIPVDPPPPRAPYPVSFDEIMARIESGEEIKPEQEVPNVVLGMSQATQSTPAKRRKPWEVHEEPEVEGVGVDGTGDEEEGDEKRGLNDTPYGGLLGLTRQDVEEARGGEVLNGEDQASSDTHEEMSENQASSDRPEKSSESKGEGSNDGVMPVHEQTVTPS